MSTNPKCTLITSINDAQVLSAPVPLSITLPSYGTGQGLLFKNVLATAFATDKIYLQVGVLARRNCMLGFQVPATYNLTVYNSYQEKILIVTNATASVWYVVPVTWTPTNILTIEIDPPAVIPAATSILWIGMGTIIELTDFFQLSSFNCPLTLDSEMGESFVKTTNGAILTLNRQITADGALDPVIFSVTETLQAGGYTVSSSNPSIIPSQPGTFSAGQSLGPQTMAIASGLFNGTLTIAFNGVGTSTAINLIASSPIHSTVF